MLRKWLYLIVLYALVFGYTGVTPGFAQHGGIGLKVSRPQYLLPAHPDYAKLLNSLYLSIRISDQFTLFADSYLFRDDGAAFDTGLNQTMNASSFSDRATVLGLLYYYPLNWFELKPYGGAGLGWHSLRIGPNEKGRDQESSKNYGAHLVVGLSYDLKFVPVVFFSEFRYAQVFLTSDAGAFQFQPSVLHRADSFPLNWFAAGLLFYFF